MPWVGDRAKSEAPPILPTATGGMMAEYKPVQLFVSRPKHRRFKKVCTQRGETMTEVLERAIDEYLRRKEART